MKLDRYDCQRNRLQKSSREVGILHLRVCVAVQKHQQWILPYSCYAFFAAEFQYFNETESGNSARKKVQTRQREWTSTSRWKWVRGFDLPTVKYAGIVLHTRNVPPGLAVIPFLALFQNRNPLSFSAVFVTPWTAFCLNLRQTDLVSVTVHVENEPNTSARSRLAELQILPPGFGANNRAYLSHVFAFNLLSRLKTNCLSEVKFFVLSWIMQSLWSKTCIGSGVARGGVTGIVTPCRKILATLLCIGNG